MPDLTAFPPDALTGVRVVTLAPNLPGPWACARLTAMGADVVKVEPPAGDLVAATAPALYAELTAGQRIVTLDLRSDDGRAELARLVGEADLLVTSMRPAAAARLGLPDLVASTGVAFVEIVGDVEDPDHPGHDLTYQARSGLLSPPAMPLVPIADCLGAERACSAALAALRLREHGRPAHVRVALEEAALFAATTLRHGLTAPGGPLGGGLPAYDVYASADGHVALAALEPHFAERLKPLGHTADELATTFASRTSAQWEAYAAEHDLPIAAVHTPSHATQEK